MIKRKRVFNGKTYVLSAATRHGAPLSHAKQNQEYLKKLGFYTRRVKIDNEYYVYAKKK